MRNPDVEELAVSPRKKRTTAPKRRAAEEAQAAPGDYVAFPDLRGLDDSNVWMDMERMGVSHANAWSANAWLLKLVSLMSDLGS